MGSFPLAFMIGLLFHDIEIKKKKERKKTKWNLPFHHNNSLETSARLKHQTWRYYRVELKWIKRRRLIIIIIFLFSNEFRIENKHYVLYPG